MEAKCRYLPKMKGKTKMPWWMEELVEIQKMLEAGEIQDALEHIKWMLPDEDEWDYEEES